MATVQKRNPLLTAMVSCRAFASRTNAAARLTGKGRGFGLLKRYYFRTRLFAATASGKRYRAVSVH